MIVDPDYEFSQIELQRITLKIRSYYQQDRKRNRIVNNAFTNYEDETLNDYRERTLSVSMITSLIKTNGLGCQHCNCKMILIPTDKSQKYKQLTLDRLNDLIDHRISNVVLACLGCNIARAKVMYGRI